MLAGRGLSMEVDGTEAGVIDHLPMAPIKHVVLLRFKKSVPGNAVKGIFKELADLKKVIPGLLDFSGGPYDSPEGLHKGFTHGFVATFKDGRVRDVYLAHPAHEAIKQKVLPLLDGGIDGAIAFDWVE